MFGMTVLQKNEEFIQGPGFEGRGRGGGGARLLMLCRLESVLRKKLSEKLICTELPFSTRFS